MSLTSFLDESDVRERFKQEFVKPRVPVNAELVAPPLSRRYSLVGTAFDYLLRFYVKRLNPDSIEREWVASEGIKRLAKQAIQTAEYDADTEELVLDGSLEKQKIASDILKRARTAYKRYLNSGKVSGLLLKSIIGLAQLDTIYRSSFVDDNLGVAHPEDIEDLRNLISAVTPERFRARRLCLLNPVFGEGSRLVGGADADIAIDEVLIDVKTIKNLRLSMNDFHQLIGYYVLHEIWGMSGVRGKPRISKVAVYFSRFAFMQIYNIKDIIDMNTFPDFLEWFRGRVDKGKTKGYGKDLRRHR